MAQLQIDQGTAEKIAEQIRISKLTGWYRAIVVPENDSKLSGAEEAGETLDHNEL